MPAALTPEEKKDRVEAKRLERTSTRKERPSFNGTKGKLSIGHGIEGFHLHIINDIPGRLDTAVQIGYTFVTASEVGGVTNNVVSRNSDTSDDKVRFIVGTTETGPLYAYLMKIPLEYYEEDQAALEARNSLVDSAINAGSISAPGTSSEGRYIPKEGIKIRRE